MNDSNGDFMDFYKTEVIKYLGKDDMNFDN